MGRNGTVQGEMFCRNCLYVFPNYPSSDNQYQDPQFETTFQRIIVIVLRFIFSQSGEVWRKENGLECENSRRLLSNAVGFVLVICYYI